MNNSKAFVAVKARYYKRDAAIAVLDHSNALRNGFTRSENIYPMFSSNNVSLYTKGVNSGVEALDKACLRYKQVTGKKVRTDFNVLFEHVVVLSEAHYSRLEKKIGVEETKRRVMKLFVSYAKNIKREYGFEPISVQLHFDEGHHDSSGKFIRNIHAHISFFNYDFEKKIAPLRHLMAKGKNEHGRTNKFNENFEKMQDIAAEVFAPLKFKRGVSQSVTGTKHLSKESFVREKLDNMEVTLNESEQQVLALREQVARHKNLSNDLTKEVANLQKRRDWLTERVDELQGYMHSLEQAVKQKCRQALIQLNRKASNFFHISKRIP
jgi:cell division protein FtsB